jgi:hypothetical protein
MAQAAAVAILEFINKSGSSPNGTDLRKLVHKNNHLYSKPSAKKVG